MSVPVLKLGSILIASAQEALSDTDLGELRDDLLARVGRLRSTGVVIDVTAVDVMDSFSTRMLRATASMLRLRGADTVIVGIQPNVALAMVQLGLTLQDVPIALDLEEGLELLRERERVLLNGRA